MADPDEGEEDVEALEEVPVPVPAPPPGGAPPPEYGPGVYLGW